MQVVRQILLKEQKIKQFPITECKILQIDALELLNSLPEKSIKLIITDPPYGIAYHSGHYKSRKNPHDLVMHDWNFQIGDFLEAVNRVLTDDGAVYLFTRWDVYPLWSHYVPSGIKLKNCIIWVKDNWSAGDLEGNFGNQYEVIMFLTKKHKIRGRRWSNIWQFPKIPSGKLLIATQKPVELLERAILSSSDEGDLVLDPFCGSGSTGEAAIKHGRKCLLGDIDIKMIKIASKRLKIEINETMDVPIILPPCPIMKVVVPEPHLWGIHPEDLLEILRIEEIRSSSEFALKEDE